MTHASFHAREDNLVGNRILERYPSDTGDWNKIKKESIPPPFFFITDRLCKEEWPVVFRLFVKKFPGVRAKAKVL